MKTYKVTSRNQPLYKGSIFTAEIHPQHEQILLVESILVGGYRPHYYWGSHFLFNDAEGIAEITDGHQDIQGN